MSGMRGKGREGYGTCHSEVADHQHAQKSQADLGGVIGPVVERPDRWQPPGASRREVPGGSGASLIETGKPLQGQGDPAGGGD